MNADAKKIIDFIQYAERLKVELRYASKSDNTRESVADHCWRLALMLILIVPKLKIEVDLLKTLKMAIIHDLVEIEAKDISALKQIGNPELRKAKGNNEKKAIKKIRKLLGDDGQEIHGLWTEYAEQKTNEAKIVKVSDKLEGQLQFLNETVTNFTDEDRKAAKIMLDETTDLSKIDPFIEELDLVSLEDRKNRVKR